MSILAECPAKFLLSFYKNKVKQSQNRNYFTYYIEIRNL